MGRSAGAGSPVWFRCNAERRGLGDPSGNRHTVALTGRSKPHQRKRGSMKGSRSSALSRQYECSCGYVGWSNHIDLEALDTAARAAQDDTTTQRSPRREHRG